MKYVKSISLFFVYPACCFLLGIMTGTQVQRYADSEIIINEAELRQEGVAEPISESEQQREVTENAEQEDIAQGQYVMNSNAISQVQEMEQITAETGYYIALQNDYVIVYHGDRETVFLSTDIKAEELPADVQADLESGMYMTDEGMLYDFLENYTS